jgi:hypothetical protein
MAMCHLKSNYLVTSNNRAVQVVRIPKFGIMKIVADLHLALLFDRLAHLLL